MWPASIVRGKKRDGGGKCVAGRESEEDEDDPFDDIWVPSLYITLKVYERDSPLLMWQKAEYHRKENNMKQRPYALSMAYVVP